MYFPFAASCMSLMSHAARGTEKGHSLPTAGPPGKTAKLSLMLQLPAPKGTFSLHWERPHESWYSPVCSQPLSFTQIITGSKVSSVFYSNFWICYFFNFTYIRLPIFFSCTKHNVIMSVAIETVCSNHAAIRQKLEVYFNLHSITPCCTVRTISLNMRLIRWNRLMECL